MIPVVVPDLGEIVETVTILHWLRAVGEPVAADEDLVELATDKMDVMIQSPAAGVVAEIRTPAGTKVRVGAEIGSIKPP
jgi:pyruvate/2-oxoglutarate dehydrogenase complex dihydrolipoamide acyltransferase (E2) component